MLSITDPPWEEIRAIPSSDSIRQSLLFLFSGPCFCILVIIRSHYGATMALRDSKGSAQPKWCQISGSLLFILPGFSGLTLIQCSICGMQKTSDNVVPLFESCTNHSQRPYCWQCLFDHIEMILKTVDEFDDKCCFKDVECLISSCRGVVPSWAIKESIGDERFKMCVYLKR